MSWSSGSCSLFIIFFSQEKKTHDQRKDKQEQACIRVFHMRQKKSCCSTEP